MTTTAGLFEMMFGRGDSSFATRAGVSEVETIAGELFADCEPALPWKTRSSRSNSFCVPGSGFGLEFAPLAEAAPDPDTPFPLVPLPLLRPFG